MHVHEDDDEEAEGRREGRRTEGEKGREGILPQRAFRFFSEQNTSLLILRRTRLRCILGQTGFSYLRCRIIECTVFIYLFNTSSLIFNFRY